MYMPERENVSEWAFFLWKNIRRKTSVKKIPFANMQSRQYQQKTMIPADRQKNMHGNHLGYENIWLDFSLRMNHGYDVWENISFLNKKNALWSKVVGG